MCSAALGAGGKQPVAPCTASPDAKQVFAFVSPAGLAELREERWVSTLVVPAPPASSHIAARSEERQKKRSFSWNRFWITPVTWGSFQFCFISAEGQDRLAELGRQERGTGSVCISVDMLTSAYIITLEGQCPAA